MRSASAPRTASRARTADADLVLPELRRARASDFLETLPVKVDRHTPAPKRPSKQQLDELRKMFRIFDDDGDGFLHFYQAMRAWRQLGVTIDRHNVVYVGEHFPMVSFDSFVENLFAVQSSLDREQEARRYFHLLDSNKKGFIAPADLHEMFRLVGSDIRPVWIDDLFDAMAPTLLHHDQLQFSEFLAFLNLLERDFGVRLLPQAPSRLRG